MLLVRMLLQLQCLRRGNNNERSRHSDDVNLLA